MSVVQSGGRCPFCQAEVPPKSSVCPACHARKQSRRGLSPLGFKAYASAWLLCTTLLVIAAAYLALLPWLPNREPPPYALRLLGAAPMQARCTVEVIQGAVVASAKIESAACSPAATAISQPAAAASPTPTRRRMAAALHGALMLSLAVLLSWLLHRSLRALFMRPGPSTWVRRTA